MSNDISPEGTAAGPACALGDCDEPAGPGGVLCPGHKQELEDALFTRGFQAAAGQDRESGAG